MGDNATHGRTHHSRVFRGRNRRIILIDHRFYLRNNRVEIEVSFSTHGFRDESIQTRMRDGKARVFIEPASPVRAFQTHHDDSGQTGPVPVSLDQPPRHAVKSIFIRENIVPVVHIQNRKTFSLFFFFRDANIQSGFSLKPRQIDLTFGVFHTTPPRPASFRRFRILRHIIHRIRPGWIEVDT